MREYLPVIIAMGLICLFSLGFLLAFALVKNKKTGMGFDRHMKDSVLIRRLIRYARPHWKLFAISLTIMVVSIGYELLSPLIIKEFQAAIEDQFQMSQIYWLVAGYASLLIVSLGCTYVQSLILQKIGQKILSALRQDTFAHIEKLSHEQLNNIPVGTLVTRVTNDTNAISMMFTNTFVNMVKNAMIVAGVLAAMLMLNVSLTLMVLCFTPFVILFTVIFRKFSRMTHRAVKDGYTAVNTYLSENLSGMKITQIFNREQEKMDDFLLRSRQVKKAKWNQIFVFGIFRPMVYMLFISCTLCLFYFSGRAVIGGEPIWGQVIDYTVVAAFYMYINRFFNPIQNLAEQFNMIQGAFASAEKIFTVLDKVPEVVDEPDAIELEEIRGDIEFRDVWFAYKPGEWVLKGVSFKVEAGQTVAFVGATGSGKTTILSLICRNYDIQQGQILIDGIDIRKIKISSLRRHFGQMLQDVFLFSGTIRSNILLRMEGVSDEEVWEACKYVNADSFISRLDHGLDEIVRERGNNFSAGQRQLLSFARTIVHKPSVMILDEATANIDTETELLIQDSLEKMRHIGTMLIVAHRLSTIQHADNIILLSSGVIVEQGNHQTLLAQRGKYYQLYTLQYEKQQLQQQ